MGISHSKGETCEALRLCKQRKKFIKQAIDSRYDFAAAHLAYVQSLREIGISLRRFAEAEVLLDSSSPLETDKTPSHSLHPSPSPPHPGAGDTLPGAGDSSHQLPVPTVSYMRAGVSNAVTVSINPSAIDFSSRVYVDDVDSMPFTMPPPPPPPESGSSWDYFDSSAENESFRFVGHDGFHVNFNDMSVHKQVDVKDFDTHEGVVTPPEAVKKDQSTQDDVSLVASNSEARIVESDDGALMCRTSQTESVKDSCLTEGEREDPSEFITHRAKDFLSSIKEIESRFFRASESGKEVSRMLEVDKIRVGYSEAKGMLCFELGFCFVVLKIICFWMLLVCKCSI